MSNVSKLSGCRVCDKVVTAKQHALECDRCQRWVHRLCGTGMSLKEYREVMRRIKNEEDFAWTCGQCSSSDMAQLVKVQSSPKAPSPSVSAADVPVSFQFFFR